MSVADSQDERNQAKTRLAVAADADLSRDLSYWTIASRDHQVEFSELAARQIQLREMHSESETWIGLIADELRDRRARSRQATG